MIMAIMIVICHLVWEIPVNKLFLKFRGYLKKVTRKYFNDTNS